MTFYLFKGLIARYVRGFLTLCRNVKHYYFNFFLKNRSVLELYPEYRGLNISRAIKSVISGYKSYYVAFGYFRLTLMFFQYWLLPLIVALMLLTSLFTLRDMPVNKFLFIALSLGFFTYLLLSGYVFFFKKYKYSKYTTAMHRYWRRTFSIFWLLEGFLFLVFLYLTMFANQEPFFGYDNIQAFKDLAYPWRIFMQEAVSLIFIIAILRYSLVRLKDMTTAKIYVTVLTVTALLLVTAWSEFYQFFYTLNHYNSVD